MQNQTKRFQDSCPLYSDPKLGFRALRLCRLLGLCRHFIVVVAYRQDNGVAALVFTNLRVSKPKQHVGSFLCPLPRSPSTVSPGSYWREKDSTGRMHLVQTVLQAGLPLGVGLCWSTVWTCEAPPTGADPFFPELWMTLIVSWAISSFITWKSQKNLLFCWNLIVFVDLVSENSLLMIQARYPLILGRDEQLLDQNQPMQKASLEHAWLSRKPWLHFPLATQL